MEHRDEIGFQIHTLSHRIKRLAEVQRSCGDENQVTGMQGWIIGYLYRNRDKAIYQRDVQSHFSLRRSTVTGLVQTMERNGLVVRSGVDFDARLKRLELTPKAMRLQEEVMENIRLMEQTLSATLTPEEKEIFLRLCDKIRAGIEERTPERGEKEE